LYDGLKKLVQKMANYDCYHKTEMRPQTALREAWNAKWMIGDRIWFYAKIDRAANVMHFYPERLV